jgi:RecB family exonuclease
MIDYDDRTHTYRDGAEILPSVTTVLSSYFGIDERFYKPGAAERGRDVHSLCADYAAGLPVKPPPELQGYVDAFKQWIFDTLARVLEIEQIIEGEIDGRRYAGRYDLLVNLGGKVTLVDIKTGARCIWHVAQVAAYALRARPRPAQGMVLYLTARGEYRENFHPPRELLQGIETFKAALAAWRQK